MNTHGGPACQGRWRSNQMPGITPFAVLVPSAPGLIAVTHAYLDLVSETLG
jgi:hypothetical protein